MNEVLTKEFQKEEAKVVVKNMAPLKASEEDGFLTLFFQKYWHIVGDEIVKFCLEILNRRKEVRSINNTSIVLLPSESVE